MLKFILRNFKYSWNERGKIKNLIYVPNFGLSYQVAILNYHSKTGGRIFFLEILLNYMNDLLTSFMTWHLLLSYLILRWIFFVQINSIVSGNYSHFVVIIW